VLNVDISYRAQADPHCIDVPLPASLEEKEVKERRRRRNNHARSGRVGEGRITLDEQEEQEPHGETRT
jgi:hypothetical protein